LALVWIAEGVKAGVKAAAIAAIVSALPTVLYGFVIKEIHSYFD